MAAKTKGATKGPVISAEAANLRRLLREVRAETQKLTARKKVLRAKGAGRRPGTETALRTLWRREEDEIAKLLQRNRARNLTWEELENGLEELETGLKEMEGRIKRMVNHVFYML